MSANTYTELTALLQTTFNQIESHLIELGMAINSSKTQLMVFHPDETGRMVTITAGGKKIHHQSTLKVLGFTFAQDAKMDDYIWRGDQNLIRSINTKIFQLRTIKPYTSQTQLANIANLTVNSQIRYVAPLWSLTGSTNQDKVQAAQIKVARAITWHRRLKYSEKPHRQILLLQLGWNNIQQMTHSATVQLVKRASNNQSSMGINSMFTKQTTENKRSHLSHCVSTMCRKKRKKLNFLDNGRAKYNGLPLILRNNSLSKYGFKHVLKQHISEQFFLQQH